MARNKQSDLRRAQQALAGELSTAEAEAEIEARKAAFHGFNPSGTKFVVRCQDGGAWDRRSLWGVLPTV